MSHQHFTRSQLRLELSPSLPSTAAVVENADVEGVCKEIGLGGELKSHKSKSLAPGLESTFKEREDSGLIKINKLESSAEKFKQILGSRMHDAGGAGGEALRDIRGAGSCHTRGSGVSS